MKSFVSFAVELCAAAVLFSGAALAQSEDVVKVRLPNAIEVAGHSLPAGDYQISEVANSGNIPLLLFRSAHTSVVVAATRVINAGHDLAAKTELVMDRDGDRYGLGRIWIAGRDYRYEFRNTSDIPTP